MIRSKRKPESHIIGEEAVRIIKNLLPAHWTAREFHPDYGIDLAVELFEKSWNDKPGHPVYDTLGEHIFLQVKGCDGMKPKKLKIVDRINVELADPKIAAQKAPDGNVLTVFPFQMETSELVTVQRMGAAVPVLLTLVDVSTQRVFFVCLNDYIDKIITPFDERYAEQETKVIHVPAVNQIVATDDGFLPFRFYGKRAKLMAAFLKFQYQQHQLENTDNDELSQQAEYFARVLLRYDFWNSCDMWRLIAHLHESLVSFCETGSPRLLSEHPPLPFRADDEEQKWTDAWSGNREYSRRQIQHFQEIRQLWDQLANVGRVYEEICREWFLPTPLGLIT